MDCGSDRLTREDGRLAARFSEHHSILTVYKVRNYLSLIRTRTGGSLVSLCPRRAFFLADGRDSGLGAWRDSLPVSCRRQARQNRRFSAVCRSQRAFGPRILYQGLKDPSSTVADQGIEWFCCIKGISPGICRYLYKYAISCKPMPTVGAGVREIRVRESSGAFRISDSSQYR
jgi:hypothetical protein